MTQPNPSAAWKKPLNFACCSTAEQFGTIEFGRGYVFKATCNDCGTAYECKVTPPACSCGHDGKTPACGQTSLAGTTILCDCCRLGLTSPSDGVMHLG